MDTLEHNYMPKVRDLINSGVLKSGCLFDCDIKHDDWCNLIVDGTGFCNCDPEVTLQKNVY